VPRKGVTEVTETHKHSSSLLLKSKNNTELQKQKHKIKTKMLKPQRLKPKSKMYSDKLESSLVELKTLKQRNISSESTEKAFCTLSVQTVRPFARGTDAVPVSAGLVLHLTFVQYLAGDDCNNVAMTML